MLLSFLPLALFKAPAALVAFSAASFTAARFFASISFAVGFLALGFVAALVLTDDAVDLAAALTVTRALPRGAFDFGFDSVAALDRDGAELAAFFFFEAILTDS
jgi:hypothetical protein